MFTLFLCYFCRANVFALFMVLSRANMFTLFYVIFLERMCLRSLWYFHERICLRCFMLFFLERMCLRCVYAVYGTFTSEYVSAVYVIFLERMCLRCLWYFHERICLLLFFLTRMCLRWVMCSFLLANMFSLFMAPYNTSTLLWYFFFFYQRGNMFMLLCGTLTSEYVLRCYMLLLQANMATVGVIYVTCEIWVYEICFYFLSFFIFISLYSIIR